MKNVYLFLVAAVIVVTSEPQKYNDDIIWFPVDDDDGVFVSIYGEKFRSAPAAKSRSHRRARSSEQEANRNLPFTHISREDYDTSFFHNIHERQEVQSSPFVPKVPPAFYEQQSLHNMYPNNPFLNLQNFKRPKNLERPPTIERPKNFKTPKNEDFQSSDAHLQDLIDEVFGKPPGDKTSEYFSSLEHNRRPLFGETSKHSEAFIDNRPLGGKIPDYSNTFFNDNRPLSGGIPDFRPVSNHKNTEGESTIEEPFKNNQGSRPNRTKYKENQQKRPNKPNRGTAEVDFVVFPDENTRPLKQTTPANALPTEPPTLSPCEKKCRVTPEYNPVCGSDSVTYTNEGRLKCAQYCGKDVVLSHYGNCGRGRLTTPLLSDTSRQPSRNTKKVEILISYI